MPDEHRFTYRIVEVSADCWRLFTVTGTAGEAHHDFPSREVAEAAAKSLATRAARLAGAGRSRRANRVQSAGPDEPVTIERVESALDKLAVMMAELGPAGQVYLPVFVRLETELAGMKATEDAMARVRDRAKQADSRTLIKPAPK